MDCHDQPAGHTPHLAPALTALVLGVIVLTTFDFYARRLETRSITALAADEAMIERDGKLSAIKNQGTALQQAALESEDLLPIYGSSELVLHRPYTRPFHPTNLFRDRPLGFTVFPVGKAQSTSLIMLQKLAAVGPILNGRKLVLSVSPVWFLDRPMAWADGYAGNFSALHAGEFAFNTQLSFPLKQEAAKAMLRYPATLADRPLLKLALESIADGSPLGLACFEAVLPLGLVHNAILRTGDHWAVLRYLWSHPIQPSTPPSPGDHKTLDWQELHRQADGVYRSRSTNNEFGLDSEQWDRALRRELVEQKSTRSRESFHRILETNQEWADLELLLRELTELGARPLLVSMPLHGRWYDQLGVTYTDRTAYYHKLREVGARHHAPVFDFADHDGDQSFCHDIMGHLAPGGWLHYSQVFDTFVHESTVQHRKGTP